MGTIGLKHGIVEGGHHIVSGVEACLEVSVSHSAFVETVGCSELWVICLESSLFLNNARHLVSCAKTLSPQYGELCELGTNLRAFVLNRNLLYLISLFVFLS